MTSFALADTLQIPFIWNEWSNVADDEYKRKLATWEKNNKARRRRNEKRASGKANSEPKAKAPRPKRCMHNQDADNFLLLAAAMKILLAQTVDVTDLPRAC